MTGQLAGKVALITGAARGIGRAAAELFASEGAFVFATDVKQPDAPFLERNISFSVMDVANEADWRDVVQAIKAKHGGVDILVNNAAIGGSQLALADENVADWNRAIATNLTGVFLGMREVLPGMRAKKSGSIINVSSIWGISAVAGAAAYHATKAAVRHLTKHAAVTYATDNVRVNSIHPGIIATPMVLEDQAEETSAKVVAATPLGRMGQPIELAKGMLFLASNESSFMTGAELVIDGGYLAQ
ncbi:SDR family oxidoreductase [Paraburkholderia nemoris]|jgi:NAD(P)-dependent dehydrogenase (short-subunit alcohol dehydrogenase family)|uniref:SDR family oxidoreductase n=1 Tax=Paraburkholderia nemoris TaxID=2793076 RepID=UPI0038B76991